MGRKRENIKLKATLQQGIDLRQHQCFQEAVKVLESVVQRFPGEASVFWLLGSIYLHDLDQPQKALPMFRKAVRLCPRSPRASLGLFHSLWDLEREREALRELNRFQSIAHCDDYDEILAEIREKAPKLLTKPPRSKAS
jgi:tetratricopeptide (TPR) repeat protein